MRSSLHRASGEALDERALQHRVEDDDRNDGSHRCRHQRSPGNTVFGHEEVNTDLHQPVGVAEHKAVADQKLIPDVDEDEHAAGQQPWFEQRQRDPVEGPQP